MAPETSPVNDTMPQARCRAAAARCDITPPIGIYHRMWGAALHDRATGVHRPLEATLLWLEPIDGSLADGRIVVSLDHCILDSAEIRRIREQMATVTGVPASQILITLSHTHGSGWMSRSRSHLPGGELIGPYLDELTQQLWQLAEKSNDRLGLATIVYGSGRCAMARHRDYWDPATQRYVCGFNPKGYSDDTLIVGRVTADSGRSIATIVNYACHPTTLAWENTLISPDWVGAMKETVEKETGGPCLFLQGASGDLGPREGFVGDTSIADRNGRQVGHAALATLMSLDPPCTSFRYAGPVVSGATLGTWKHEAATAAELQAQTTWKWQSLTFPLPYRPDLPTVQQTTDERDFWLREEETARAAGDEDRIRNCRAQVEQRSRQLTRLQALVPGSSWPLPVEIGILGNAIWIFVPGELYQVFQMSLRQRFAPRPVVITTLTNDWQPGYIPPASSYGFGIYQEIIAATAQGCLESLINAVGDAVGRML